jgi:phytoene synthase
MLPPRSARCIKAARVLYSRILERIEAQDYDVFARRASVPTTQKALMVARLMLPVGG